MKITNHEDFLDAQSLAKIAFFSANKEQAEMFWSAAMKSLKLAYGVK